MAVAWSGTHSLLHQCRGGVGAGLCWLMAGVRGKLRSGSEGQEHLERPCAFKWVSPDQIHRMRACCRLGVPNGSHLAVQKGVLGSNGQKTGEK